MTQINFIDIINFTILVKVVLLMKLDRKAVECVENKFLKIPNIQKYEIYTKTENGFDISVEMDDGYEFMIEAYYLKNIYPSNVKKFISEDLKDKKARIIVSPYISERTAELCEQHGIGYFDFAGNCYFVGHSIFLSEKGNKNTQPKEQRAVSIFERSSVVSSRILRELFSNLTKVWKLKYLAEKVDCSIGQVSKLMNYLIDNAWAEKSKDGYRIVEPESLLKAWSADYGKKVISSYPCYSLDSISVIEGRLKMLKKDTGIESYLTGFAGGVRYAPVIRYNKLHVYIAPEDIKEAILYLDMKEVSSGANVVIMPLEDESYSKDYRIIDGAVVVSPVQAYLDSMQLKGRGEELAENILKKEILK